MGMNFSPMYQPVSTKTIKADGDLNINPYDLLATDVKCDTVEATEFVGGVGNFSSVITNTLGVPFNANGVKYAEGNTVNYNTQANKNWESIGILNPPASNYPQWLKITPPECRVTGSLRSNTTGVTIGIRFVNSSGEVEYTVMHQPPDDTYYAKTFECMLNPYDSYTVEIYTGLFNGATAYFTTGGLTIQA